MSQKLVVNCAFDRMVPISKVKPNPDNPNSHTTKQIDLLVKLLKVHGWRAPVVISNRSGLITRGHGRFDAAVKAGEKKVPVDFQDYSDEDMELADLVADNSIQELSYYDRALLKEVLGEIDAHPVDIELTGFTVIDVEELFSAAPPPDFGSGSSPKSSSSSSEESSKGKDTEKGDGDQGKTSQEEQDEGQGGETGKEEGDTKEESSDGGRGSGEDPLDDDVLFTFGVYRGRVQRCVFDDFEKFYTGVRRDLKCVTLDDAIRYMVRDES